MSMDTIAAVATPPGRGGIGIIRVSGPAAGPIARAVLGQVPEPRFATYAAFLDDHHEAVDQGIALFFPGPNSFTGEDVLELQGHGGQVVLDQVLARVLELGARMARPGEFSERAFLNGRIDLVQAEAIADLIDSGSLEASRAARRSLQGEFSDRINVLVARLTAIRVQIESGLDFADEDIEPEDMAHITSGIAEAREGLELLLREAGQGTLLREGMTVVLAGPPNAGKSSLLNRLARREAAIVTDIPGTTRDVLREHIQIDGMPLHVLDTAGLRESDDPVERAGVLRARDQIEQADRILFVVDDGDASEAWRNEFERLPATHLTLVRNKADLSGRVIEQRAGANGVIEIALSARTGEGVETLCGHLKECMGYRTQAAGQFSARRRHVDALERTLALIERAARARDHELVAEELRLAQNALGEITGTVTSDDLLGEIFSSFCIGK